MASKAVERAVLDMCTERVTGFPTSPAADHESPDFLVTTGGRTIGIEMQEFIQGATGEGAPAREGESLRSLAMTMARREFESRHPGVHLYVYGHWVRAVALDRRTLPELGRQVASLVEKLVPPAPGPGQGISRRDATYEELDAARLADKLLRLDVHLFPPATFGVWGSPEWGIASRDLADLNAQIAAKENKVEAYREACDEVWLVMFALAMPSGGFDMDVLVGLRVQSDFDHVVFLDAVSGNHLLLAG